MENGDGRFFKVLGLVITSRVSRLVKFLKITPMHVPSTSMRSELWSSLGRILSKREMGFLKAG